MGVSLAAFQGSNVVTGKVGTGGIDLIFVSLNIDKELFPRDDEDALFEAPAEIIKQDFDDKSITIEIINAHPQDKFTLIFEVSNRGRFPVKPYVEPGEPDSPGLKIIYDPVIEQIDPDQNVTGEVVIIIMPCEDIESNITYNLNILLNYKQWNLP